MASFNFFRFILLNASINGCDMMTVVIVVIVNLGLPSSNFFNEMILLHNVQNLFKNLRHFFSNWLCYVNMNLNRSSRSLCRSSCCLLW